MNQKTIAVVAAVCIIVGLGIFFVVKMQKPATNSVEVAAVVPEVSSVASTTADVAPTTPSTQSSDTTSAANTKIYTNIAFGYSFSYPNNWVLEPETSVVDAQNDMPSMISVHDAKLFSPQRFSVTINRKERTLKNEAPKTESITVAGQTVTAYLFPNGKDCKPTKTDPDCSFFLIPIQRNGVWYEISVANEAATLDAYRTILASFKFTK